MPKNKTPPAEWPFPIAAVPAPEDEHAAEFPAPTESFNPRAAPEPMASPEASLETHPL